MAEKRTANPLIKTATAYMAIPIRTLDTGSASLTINKAVKIEQINREIEL